MRYCLRKLINLLVIVRRFVPRTGVERGTRKSFEKQNELSFQICGIQNLITGLDTDISSLKSEIEDLVK